MSLFAICCICVFILFFLLFYVFLYIYFMCSLTHLSTFNNTKYIFNKSYINRHRKMILTAWLQPFSNSVHNCWSCERVSKAYILFCNTSCHDQNRKVKLFVVRYTGKNSSMQPGKLAPVYTPTIVCAHRAALYTVRWPCGSPYRAVSVYDF